MSHTHVCKSSYSSTITDADDIHCVIFAWNLKSVTFSYPTESCAHSFALEGRISYKIITNLWFLDFKHIHLWECMSRAADMANSNMKNGFFLSLSVLPSTQTISQKQCAMISYVLCAHTEMRNIFVKRSRKQVVLCFQPRKIRTRLVCWGIHLCYVLSLYILLSFIQYSIIIVAHSKNTDRYVCIYAVMLNRERVRPPNSI